MGIEDSDEITQRELRTHRHDVEDARREGVIEGLEWGLEQAMRAADRQDAEHRIRAEIERLKGES